MKKIFFLPFLAFFFQTAIGQNAYFFPSGATFDPAIPSPEQFLGYPVGE